MAERAPVQGQGSWWLSHGHRGHQPTDHEPGTIAWHEHVEAWNAYAKLFGSDQSAERIAERGGFGWGELVSLLGHEPATWEPMPRRFRA